MRIALDASDLSTERLDGTTVYAKELLPRLTRELVDRGHDVIAFAPRPPTVAFPESDRVHLTVISGERFWTQTRLTRALFTAAPDLLFLPIQTVPLYRPRTLRVVATVHDLDFLDYPETYVLKNRLLLQWFTRVVARNATHLIAVSHATKRAVVERYGRPAGDITVIHHGVDREHFRPPKTPEEREASCTRVRATYGIPPSPILFVGALQPRKNVPGLVAAFERLKRAGRPEHLVLVSGNAWKEHLVLDGIAHSPARGAIHILRSVPLSDLPALYWNAGVFVLPSFSEGFGLPVLEAMACGTPVVVSTAPALTEVTGDAALARDPRDTAGLSDTIRVLLDDTDTRREMVDRGIRHTADFSWERCTTETAGVIDMILRRV